MSIILEEHMQKCPDKVKKNRKITTRNRSDLETLGFWRIYAQKPPRTLNDDDEEEESRLLKCGILTRKDILRRL